MKMGFYSATVGPGGMLKTVAGAASKRGHETVVFEPNKTGVAASRKEEMANCSVVAMGFSSQLCDEEMVLAEYLLGKKIPIVEIEDVPGSSARPLAKEVAPRVARCYVAMPGWIENAREFGFRVPSYVGPPPHWGDSYVQMDAGESMREGFMERVDQITLANLSRYHRIIYVPGTKNPQQVNKFLAAIVDAGSRVLHEDFVLGFRAHPGEDPKKGDEAIAAYRQAIEERKEILNGISLLESGSATSANLVGAADITFFPGGGPTESIVAAYQRKNAIYYWDADVEKALKGLGVPDGKWFPAEMGGVLKVTTPEELCAGISSLLTRDGQAALRASQEKNFEITSNFNWNTGPLLAEKLEAIARA